VRHVYASREAGGENIAVYSSQLDVETRLACIKEAAKEHAVCMSGKPITVERVQDEMIAHLQSVLEMTRVGFIRK
jgi:uncharacterized protein (DUF1697 family)